MLVNPFNFDELIHPISSTEFLNEYWEKKPLILQNRASGYDKLFSLKDADFLISTLPTPNSTWIRFINNNNELRVEDYLNKEHLSILDKNKVMRGFNNGNTIVLNALHRRFDPIRKFCKNLEGIFGHNVGANMYLTPSTAQGFSAHFDAHNVMILQIDGQKLWKIYDQPILFPIVKEDTPFLKSSNSPTLEIFLKPGDLLYMPRGLVHEALTEKSYSLHLTVGIHVATWVDLIKEMALQEETLREALPIGILSNTNDHPIDEKRIIDVLCKNKNTIHQALEKLRTKFDEKRASSFYGELSAIKNAEEITVSTLLSKKKGLKHSMSTDDNHVIIHYGKNAYKAPAAAELLLDYVMEAPQFSIQTLPDYLQFLSESSKLALVKSLVKAGLLVPSKLVIPGVFQKSEYGKEAP
jgi:ribosomal protein L16 Arg81 hydroxylase